MNGQGVCGRPQEQKRSAVEERHWFHKQQICQEQLFIAACENSTHQRKRLLPHRVELEMSGGRKRLTEPEITGKLKNLVEDTTCGDTETPLLWTCKNTRQLSDALSKIGFCIGRQKVSELLAELGYSLQGNRKTKEGRSHPDRDKQFCFLNRRVKLFQRFGQGYFS